MLLALADLHGMSEEQVKDHIVCVYDVSGDEVDKYDVLIAYESVGNWGCDSSSFFLMRNKETGELFENHGGHCSCYGFEGQWDPTHTNLLYLTSEKFHFVCGGYDDDNEEHKRLVKEYITDLTKSVS